MKQLLGIWLAIVAIRAHSMGNIDYLGDAVLLLLLAPVVLITKGIE